MKKLWILLCFSAFLSSGGEPILKVGIFGDVQAYASKADWGMTNLEKAFQLFEPQKPDLLLQLGDLCDRGDAKPLFGLYHELVRRYLPKNIQQLHCAGNHEFWVDAEPKDSEALYRAFVSGLGQSPETPCHIVIRGYDFIAFSEDAEQYSPEKLALLKAALDKAVQRDAEKPIFLLTHFPPADTVSGSHGPAGQKALRELLNGYRQVVSFSGHSHYPLEDERCIWQGEFTAVTTSTLSYGCMEERPYNALGANLPFGREAIQVLSMEIFSDRLVIHRYNAEDNREIKPDRPWVIALPYRPEKARYTAERVRKRKAPAFPDNAEIVLRLDYWFAYLLFNAAEHDDFVHFYKIAITEKGKPESRKEFLFAADFYRLERNRDSRPQFRLPCEILSPGKSYCFEVYPTESFGLTGEPLRLETEIPATYHFQKSGRPLYPQE